MGRHVGMDRTCQLELLLVRSRGKHFRHVFDQRVQVEIDFVQFQLAGFDLGEVEDVVDQA